MALNLRIIPESKFSIVNAHGDITLNDISGIVAEAAAHSDWGSDFDALIDMRKAGNLLPYTDYHSVPQILQMLRIARGTKHALVVATKFQRAAVDLWKPIAMALGMEFRTFMEINEAYKWLGVSRQEINKEYS